jgi:DNA-binding MarR family transcriptional regulator
MKGFYIEVSNNLLDAKHFKRMGESVWLFMWLLDKITTITLEKGKVLGGKPIKFSDIKKDIGISRSTYFRWMETLEAGGYINAIRTPRGKSIVVLRAKKRFKKMSDVSNSDQKSESSDVSYPTHHSPTYDTSGVSHPTHHGPTYDTSNKTIAVDNKSEDNKSVDPFGADAPTGRKKEGRKISETSKLPEGKGKKNIPPADLTKSPSYSFTDQLESLKRFENIKDVPHKEIVEIISSFLPVFPGDFTDKDPFAIPATRKAISNLLMVSTLEEVKVVIKGYSDNKNNRFCPLADNIHSFCKFRFNSIKSFLEKSQSSGLYAHRRISSDEQYAVRGEQYNKKMEETKERQQKIKENWIEEHPNEKID